MQHHHLVHGGLVLLLLGGQGLTAVAGQPRRGGGAGPEGGGEEACAGWAPADTCAHAVVIKSLNMAYNRHGIRYVHQCTSYSYYCVAAPSLLLRHCISYWLLLSNIQASLAQAYHKQRDDSIWHIC